MANRIDPELSQVQGLVSTIRSKAFTLDARFNDGEMVVSSMPEPLRQLMLEELGEIRELTFKAADVLQGNAQSSVR